MFFFILVSNFQNQKTSYYLCKDLISQKYKYRIMIIELTYILYIIFVLIIFGLLEAFFYRKYGKFNRKQWIIDSLALSEYHAISWFMLMTPVVIFPSVFYFIMTYNLIGSIRLFFIGLGTYFIAGVIEDRLFFVFANHKFDPKNVPWHKGWLNIGTLKIPHWYIIFTALGFILFYLASFFG